MDTTNLFQQASNMIGHNIVVEGLMRKTGRLKGGIAEAAKDVLGFDYLLRHENTCYEYYAANPPFIGMTQPMPTICPLGVEIIDEYEIDYTKAVEIFNQGNWGSGFTSILLFKPLVYPQATEPYWYFKTNIGVQVVIGANSGKVVSPKSKTK